MIRFGILGTASIARALFDHPLEKVQITAIASRDKRRANEFGDHFGIPKRFATYESLLADRDIDAVYIPLPQHLHCEYVVKAAKARKHVLVEKPAALTVAEIRRMVSACKKNRVLFMEGFMYRFMRVHNRAKEIVSAGTIGKLKYVDFNWCFNIHQLRRSAFRLDKKSGGGALYDLGIYGADFLRYVTGGKPHLLHAYIHRERRGGVDMFAHAAYKIGGVFGTSTCGFNTDANYYALTGEYGSLYVAGSLSGRSTERVIQVHLLGNDKRYEERFPPENPYVKELEYFAGCIEQGEKPFLDGENSLQNLRLIKEIFERANPI